MNNRPDEDVKRFLTILYSSSHLHIRGSEVQEGTIQSELWINLPGHIDAKVSWGNSIKHRRDEWLIQFNHRGLTGLDLQRQWVYHLSTSTNESNKRAYGQMLSSVTLMDQHFMVPPKMDALLSVIINETNNWRLTQTGKNRIWTHSDRLSTAKIGFNENTHFLSRLYYVSHGAGTNSKGLSLDWNVEELGKSTPQVLPDSSHWVRTGNIVLSAPIPSFKDLAVQRIVNKMVDYCDNQRKVHMYVTLNGNRSEVWRNGAEIWLRDFRNQLNWHWTGRSITFVKGGSKFYAITPINRLLEFFSKREYALDPYVQAMIGGHNFALRTLKPGSTATIFGSLGSGDQEVSLLSLKFSGLQIALKVNEASGFISESNEKAIDKGGNTFSQIVTDYQLLPWTDPK